MISKRQTGLLLGPILFIITNYFLKFETLNSQAQAVLASTLWIAVWWIFEAVPLAVTSLLPIVLFPLFGDIELKETTSSYGHKYMFLFVGGFILSIAIEKWNLHKRIALNIINIVGSNMNHIIMGFMIATAFLSMWISNTATTVMILPVAVAIYKHLENQNNNPELNKEFGKALMLSLAYSASIGGMATLIGTPPNLILASVINESYSVDLSFSKWFSFGFPISVVLLFLSWLYLTFVAFDLRGKKFPGGKQEIKLQLKDLGIMTYEEKVISGIFVLTAFAWISRSLFLSKLIPSIDDTIIAVSAAVVLFIIPAKAEDAKLIKWEEARKLPWGILLLFGGGMALAKGFDSSGLALWLGKQMSAVSGLNIFLIIVIIVAAVNFLTEITSNMATTAILLPVLVTLSANINIHPYLLMVAATVAASCAFMLPVATPPNAIVLGSGIIEIKDMVRRGFLMNLISILVLSLFVYFLLPLLWGLN